MGCVRDDAGAVTDVVSIGPNPIPIPRTKETLRNLALGRYKARSHWPLSGELQTWEWVISRDQYVQAKTMIDTVNAHPGTMHYSRNHTCPGDPVRAIGLPIPKGMSPVKIKAKLQNPFGLQQQLGPPVVRPASDFTGAPGL
jgi:hypothetical protein